MPSLFGVSQEPGRGISLVVFPASWGEIEMESSGDTPTVCGEVVHYHLTKLYAGFFCFKEIQIFIAQLLQCAAP
jgi:hypothetical protein